MKLLTAKGRNKKMQKREIIIKCNFKNFNFHTLFEARKIKVLESFLYYCYIYSNSQTNKTKQKHQTRP